MIIKTIKI